MTSFEPSARVQRIKISPTTAAAALTREMKAAGRNIVDLTIGEPDFDTPEPIRAAAIAAIERGETRYTSVNGTPQLRKAIIDDYSRRLGLAYSDNEICIGGGAKQILFIAMTVTLNPGDEVIIPAPYWVSYPDMALANDGVPVIVPCPQEDGFLLTPERLEAAITPKTRGLVLNTPGNPTGAAYSETELAALAEVLLRHPRIMVLCDEIYDQIWFQDEPIRSLVSVEPRMRDQALVVNGVSKAYAMTGWRIGYGAGPADMVSAINKLQSQESSCPSSISQAAAAFALSSPDQSFIKESVTCYRQRKDFVVSRLNATPGLSCSDPAGAFYLYANCAEVIGKTTPDGTVIENDKDFVLYLLEKGGVSSVHGEAYGLSPYFRLSIASSMDTLREGCNRIEAACRALR
ncbi:MAG: aspartate transaminase [Geminicoccaceae bacterium]